MIRILFVCHGNICRSPMAEFVMKNMLQTCESELRKAGLNVEDFEIASAATSDEEIGNPVYPPARRMLASHGIDCCGKTARQMTPRDFEYYDYIVLMDANNVRNLRWISPRAASDYASKISLLMDWTGHPRDVADPWYTGDFTATWNDVNEGCRSLLKRLLSENRG